jgi:hypothetical protein
MVDRCTENVLGQVTIPPGQPNQTWVANGLSPASAQQVFKIGKGSQGWVHPGEYTYSRCQDTARAYVAVASVLVDQSRTGGYNVATNNCLTKAVSILRGYGSDAPSAAGVRAPNLYMQAPSLHFMPLTSL